MQTKYHQYDWFAFDFEIMPVAVYTTGPVEDQEMRARQDVIEEVFDPAEPVDAAFPSVVESASTGWENLETGPIGDPPKHNPLDDYRVCPGCRHEQWINRCNVCHHDLREVVEHCGCELCRKGEHF